MEIEDLIGMEIEDLISITLTILIVFGSFFVYAILGTLVGAIIGWLVSITPLGSLVEGGFAVFSFDVAGRLPHIGATLGSVKGFFKGIIQVKKEVSKG